MSSPRWSPAFPVDSLAPGHSRLVRDGRTQIAVFRLDDGSVHAVDNRCPHEGYPLTSGYVRGTTLTCAWHNFKFDVCSGACLMGDEAVHVWPVRVVDGQVEVDLAPPDPAAGRPRLWRSLEQGLHERQQGRIARDVARLLDTGVAPVEIALFGALFDAARGEYGPSHALAVAYDILAVTPEGLDATNALTQALDVATEAQVRRPIRARPPALPLPADPAAALRAAVEAEDAATAEGIVRGAVATGVAFDEIDRWIGATLRDHFLDFGHPLIYEAKLFALLAAAAPHIGPERLREAADLLIGTHVYGIVTGTREDTLPPWSGYRRRVATYDLAELASRPRPGHLAVDALVGLEAPALLDRVLASDAPVAQIVAALSEAGAAHLLDFDVAIDARLDVQNDWLDVTHRLTVVNAARKAAGPAPTAEGWVYLLQAAWFVGKATPLDGPRPPATPGLAPDAAALAAAIRRRDTPAALGHADALLAAGAPDAVRDVLVDLSLGDVGVRGIVVAHLLKSTLAAFEEYEALGSPTPVRAVVRWMATGAVERRIARRAHEAVRLVRDGKPPEKLAD